MEKREFKKLELVEVEVQMVIRALDCFAHNDCERSEQLLYEELAKEVMYQVSNG